MSDENMPRLRVVIVDDELLAREGLVADLATLDTGPRIEVVAVCADGYAARDALQRLHPDIVFLDIEMPELDGFALLDLLEPEDVPPAVIFVTAYDEHAVRAFEAHALDYILKPVVPARLGLGLVRAARRVHEARAARDALTTDPESRSASDATPPDGYLTQLLVRESGRTLVVPVDALDWIEADTYYVRLHSQAMTRPRLLRERMSVLEARLDPSRFFRTHRSAIVRLDRVREIRSVSRYEHTVLLVTGAQVPLSRDRRSRLEERLHRVR